MDRTDKDGAGRTYTKFGMKEKKETEGERLDRKKREQRKRDEEKQKLERRSDTAGADMIVLVALKGISAEAQALFRRWNPDRGNEELRKVVMSALTEAHQGLQRARKEIEGMF